MIPPFDSNGYLPPGIHEAAWEEFSDRFGYNSQRRKLIVAMKAAITNISGAGCGAMLIDGSFVTEKELPLDYDACYESGGVDCSKLDSVILDTQFPRIAQKAKYLGDIFDSETIATIDGVIYRDYFQSDRLGIPKGIVRVDIRRVK